MRARNQPVDVIADYLRVTTRSVQRYLELPCPEPLPDDKEVELASFVYEGACAAFPEVDWLSRSSLVQAEAKAICQYCPVLDKCRSYGLNKGRDQRGVLGGMTMAERAREVRRQRQREQQPRRPGVVARNQGAA
ncbi:transcription factor WhiB [Mycobacterium paraffinicum]|uniref:Transcription factor WhiB n=2 Tax=Mycobacteriaceae TaxID=1762 RepID=A0A1Q4HP69_9MYCO|nr:transcription factor WhiB [Mycobacterium intracellulare subsp. yongonense]OJZ69492.1 transcription factor WhiB [Mycobacterium paraffinicum]